MYNLDHSVVFVTKDFFHHLLRHEIDARGEIYHYWFHASKLIFSSRCYTDQFAHTKNYLIKISYIICKLFCHSSITQVPYLLIFMIISLFFELNTKSHIVSLFFIFFDSVYIVILFISSLKCLFCIKMSHFGLAMAFQWNYYGNQKTRNENHSICTYNTPLRDSIGS